MQGWNLGSNTFVSTLTGSAAAAAAAAAESL